MRLFLAEKKSLGEAIAAGLRYEIRKMVNG